MQYLQVGCACLIGLVFAVSAFTKVRDFEGFAASVPDLLPFGGGPAAGRASGGGGHVRPIASLVLVLEALAPVLLAVPATRPAGFGVALALLAAFTSAIALTLRRGRRASCRCFGASNAPLGARHLVRNGVLFTAAALGLATPGGPPVTAGLAVAVAAGAVAAILIVAFDDIADLLAGSL
ncbi:MauE/DoxX family redox-associated membrane protein [Actinomadura xylanilytica]|uniref:MauE/DoxX family redox-associated membrane protein n=1 Tax=Actinomadura xylanilytica TaxID=887459 RepID=UPI00255ABC87|nr:MauE/DoxX family redox-associated membrane protein [Actinomadura xylanilytica]MDL4777147.1 MauE/DoxX family redox-associated membrane protein [Actinomadura xylanilytica]